jgi:uncharacterized protein (TIGR02588 family)
MADKDEGGPAGTPLLEWIASSIGATFALGLIGFLTFDGLTAATPPDVSVHPGVVQPRTQGYALTIVAQNNGGSTAAEVDVEGTLTAADGSQQTSHATFDFIPGKSDRRGTLMFQSEPAADRLQLRVISYREP